jgi:hypothetical protein
LLNRRGESLTRTFVLGEGGSLWVNRLRRGGLKFLKRMGC